MSSQKELEKALEAGGPLEENRESSDSGSSLDDNLVTWNGDKDPQNPQNWSRGAKWSATGFFLFTLISSTIIAPALPIVAKNLGISSDAEMQVSLSAFVLGYAFGPLILGPLSELYGRYTVLQATNVWFFAWNLACGFAPNKDVMIVARLFSGISGSAPLSVGSGLLSDVWSPEERGKSLALYSIMPLLGPCIGPIACGYITQSSTWRWCFWGISILDGCLIVLAYFFFHETHGSTILHKKAKQLRKTTGNTELHTKYELAEIGRSPFALLKRSLLRPLRLLTTHPIIQVIAVYMAYTFGLLYVVISTFASLWTEVYHYSVSVSGLFYIAFALGESIGAQVGGRLLDRYWEHLKETKSPVLENRVPVMIPAAICTPLGLFVYGWSAGRTHWIVPCIGIAIFAGGTTMSTQTLNAYIIDTYPDYAASAIAAATVMRYVTGFAFPLFAPQLYFKLGYGWGNSVLAFVCMSLGLPTPILLWKFGARLRAKGDMSRL